MSTFPTLSTSTEFQTNEVANLDWQKAELELNIDQFRDAKASMDLIPAYEATVNNVIDQAREYCTSLNQADLEQLRDFGTWVPDSVACLELLLDRLWRCEAACANYDSPENKLLDAIKWSIGSRLGATVSPNAVLGSSRDSESAANQTLFLPPRLWVYWRTASGFQPILLADFGEC